MTDKADTILTPDDLIRWANDESRTADSLEQMLPGLPEEAKPSLQNEIDTHRRRRDWLCELVAAALVHSLAGEL